MKKILLVALAAVGLASCVQNEELVVAGSKTAIAFSDAYVYNATKADPTTTTASIQDFDVWAFMDSVRGTVFTDEDVERDGNVWSYLNTQYWYPNHTYYFAALSPANSANVTEDLAAGDAAKLGLGEIAFTNVDGTEDLLYAKAKVTTLDAATLANQGMEPVKMQFQHLLSKVKFTFQNGFASDLTTVKVTGVKMTAPKAGTIDLAQANYAAAWELSPTEPDFELAFGDVASTLTTTDRSAVAAHERLTIPATAAKEYTVTFNVEVFQGSVSALSTPITATISGIALEMGKAYNFTAVINQDVLDLKPIQFTASVDDWTPAGDFSAYIYEADGFGKDSTTGFYHIENRAGLQYFAAQVNGGRTFVGEKVVLDGDIDLSATRAASNWTPIGNVVTSTYESKKFAGTFDGQGHSVKNMVVTEQKTAAFFGSMYAGTIKNLTIENATVSSNHYAAGIVAWTERGGKALVIENCHVKNSTIVSTPELVNGAYDNGDKVGGIVGHAYGIDALKNCSVENTAITAYRDLGGIAGYATKSKITNCLVKNVTVSQDLTNGYKSEVPTTLGAVVGRDGGNNVIENNTVENVAVATAANNAEELYDALAASDNASIVLAEGTFNVGNGLGNGNAGELTIAGAGIDKTTINTPANQHGNNQLPGLYGNNKDLVFKNLTFVTTNNGYEGGIGHAKSVTFINCKIVGQFYCHSSAPHTFIDCTIDPLTGYLYTYASNCDFEGCTFTASEGKALQVYAEAPGTFNINIKNCEFTAAKVAQTWDNKPVTAIDINSAYGAKMIVNIENCEATGFGVGEFSGNGLWNIKSGALNAKAANVTVDGEVAYLAGAEFVSNGLWKSGSTYSVTNAEGLAALNSILVADKIGVDASIEILADIDFAGKTWTAVRSHIDWKSTMNELNGNGHTISNLTINGKAMFTIFANNHDVVVKDITFDNAQVNTSDINAAIIVGQTYNNLLLENVDVKNSTIVGSYKVAALVGTVYDEKASTVTATLKGCDVANTTVKSTQYDFCTAGLVSFVYADNNDKIEFENCSVSDVKLYGPTTYGYKAHAAIYTTGSETLFNEAEGVTVTNVTFENI